MEVYKKVYIKSEADIPTDQEIYIAHFMPENKVEESLPCYFKKAVWHGYVDWYLLPVTLPSEEEINKECEERYWIRDGVKWLLSKLG